ARSINHAAGTLTLPSPAGKFGTPLTPQIRFRSLVIPSMRSNVSDVTTGFLKNDPALRQSGSSGAINIAFRARISRTASRVSLSEGLIKTFEKKFLRSG